MEESNAIYNETVLKDIREGIEEVRIRLNQVDPEFQVRLNDAVNDILRAVRQFTVLDKMIIVVCGMLKAGKSTLINLLARSKNASPVGFGVDTTKRWAVIRRGESREGCIKCYYATNSEKKDRALMQVFDCLRGVKLTEPARYEVKSHELTTRNLRAILCGDVGDDNGILTREPLLVVVEPQRETDGDDSGLLSQNVMILDMPGLDSDKAQKSIEDYSKVVSESDVIFYIQSSVSPLNDAAKKLLTSALGNRPPETINIIQNRIMSQMWRKESVQADAQKRQLDQALEDIYACCKEARVPNPEGNISCFMMNLGMAYDGCDIGGKDLLNTEGVMPDGAPITDRELLHRSCFDNFEKKVCEQMRGTGCRHRARHCAGEIRRGLVRLRELLDRYRTEQLDPQVHQADEALKSWSELDKRLETEKANCCLPQSAKRLKLSESFKDVIKNHVEDVRLSVAKTEDFSPFMKDGGIRVKTGLLDRFLERCNDKMAEVLSGVLTSCALKDVLLGGKEENRVNDFLNKNLKERLFGACEEFLKKEPRYDEIWRNTRIEYEFLPNEKLFPDVITRPSIDLVKDLQKSGYPYKKKKWIVWETKEDVSTGVNDWRKLKELYFQDAERYVDEYGRVLLNKLFEKGKNSGMKPVCDAVAEKLAESKKKVNDAEALKKAVQEEIEKLGGLELNAERIVE